MPAPSLPEVLPISPIPVQKTAVSVPPGPLWARYASTARIVVSRCLMAGLAVLVLFTKSSWVSQHPVAAALVLTAGLLLTGMAAAGRLWCSLYIAGYKDKKLVADGPYSVCRHPLYFFSLLGAVGAAAATGTFTIPVLMTVIFLIGYQPVMAAEEAKLHKLFGLEQEAYQKRVPRLFPKWSLLTHASSWNSNPAVFFKHATAVIWFPAAAGIMMLLPALQSWLQLPLLMKIP